MKKLSLLFASVFVSAFIFSIGANGQQRDPLITRTFQATTIKAAEVITSGGSINLNGDAGSQAVVEVFVSRDNWPVARIKQTLEENYIIDIKVENGKLYVEAKQKSNFNQSRQGLNISFKISVPKQVNSNLRTSGGSIRIGNLSGSHDFKTSGGSITVDNVSGNINGQTSGGSVNVKNAHDNIDLKTSGGSITASDCSGKINLVTSGGSVTIRNLNGNINATTSGGSITASNIQGTLKTGTSGGSMRLNGISGNVDARTSGGSMTVEVVSVSEYVKLSNSGSLSLSLPAGHGYNLNVRANRIETSGLADFRGNTSSTNLEGTVGRGGALIEVRTSQRVSLSFR